MSPASIKLNKCNLSNFKNTSPMPSHSRVLGLQRRKDGVENVVEFVWACKEEQSLSAVCGEGSLASE